MMSKQKKTGFVYSSYWGTWSRLLDANDSEAIELNLTPVNRDYKNAGKEVIRKHYTPLGEVHDKLPDHVHIELEMQYGKVHADRLLTFDYLPNIDWDMYERFKNGGCEYGVCCKEEEKKPLETWQDSCKTREAALCYLANKPSSYKQFFSLSWVPTERFMTVKLSYMMVIWDLQEGTWVVIANDSGQAQWFDSIEQAIAYITHKWW